MDPVRQAIATKLLATSAVTNLLSSPTAVYHRRAPVEAVTPYVLFHRQSANHDEYTFDGHGVTNDLWTVRAVDRTFEAGVAEDIAVAIDAALHWATLTVTGYQPPVVTKQLTVDYGEPDGAEQFTHQGGMYRLKLVPTS
jgi:hypothetical protein